MDFSLDLPGPPFQDSLGDSDPSPFANVPPPFEALFQWGLPPTFLGCFLLHFLDKMCLLPPAPGPKLGTDREIVHKLHFLHFPPLFPPGSPPRNLTLQVGVI